MNVVVTFSLIIESPLSWVSQHTLVRCTGKRDKIVESHGVQVIDSRIKLPTFSKTTRIRLAHIDQRLEQHLELAHESVARRAPRPVRLLRLQIVARRGLIGDGATVCGAGERFRHGGSDFQPHVVRAVPVEQVGASLAEHRFGVRRATILVLNHGDVGHALLVQRDRRARRTRIAASPAQIYLVSRPEIRRIERN